MQTTLDTQCSRLRKMTPQALAAGSLKNDRYRTTDCIHLKSLIILATISRIGSVFAAPTDQSSTDEVDAPGHHRHIHWMFSTSRADMERVELGVSSPKAAKYARSACSTAAFAPLTMLAPASVGAKIRAHRSLRWGGNRSFKTSRSRVRSTCEIALRDRDLVIHRGDQLEIAGPRNTSNH